NEFRHRRRRREESLARHLERGAGRGADRRHRADRPGGGETRGRVRGRAPPLADELMEVLQTEQRGSAVWLWLNRPDLRNALNDLVLNSISSSLKVLEEDATCRVIVLAGRG